MFLILVPTTLLLQGAKQQNNFYGLTVLGRNLALVLH